MKDGTKFKSLNQILSGNSKAMKCEKHGVYSSLNIVSNIWSRCPSCFEETSKKEEQKRAEESRVENWQRVVARAGIPERFREAGISQFEVSNEGQQRALNFAKKYIEEFDQVLQKGRCAVFLGCPGTGKTHLSCSIALALLAREYTVRFEKVISAVRNIRETWRFESGQIESRVIAGYVSPDFLILDEVGNQYGSETEKLLCFEIINERYERYKPTLLISNAPLEDFDVQGTKKPGFRSFVGERVYDRIREEGGSLVVFDWASCRGGIKAAAR